MFFSMLQGFYYLWPENIRARRDLKNCLTVNIDSYRDGKGLRGQLVQPFHFLDEEIDAKPVMSQNHYNCWYWPTIVKYSRFLQARPISPLKVAMMGVHTQ